VSSTEQLLPPGHVLRYTLKERLTHWVAAGAYIYLLITGLAFWSPWLFWAAVILGRSAGIANVASVGPG